MKTNFLFLIAFLCLCFNSHGQLDALYVDELRIGWGSAQTDRLFSESYQLYRVDYLRKVGQGNSLSVGGIVGVHNYSIKKCIDYCPIVNARKLIQASVNWISPLFRRKLQGNLKMYGVLGINGVFYHRLLVSDYYRSPLKRFVESEQFLGLNFAFQTVYFFSERNGALFELHYKNYLQKQGGERGFSIQYVRRI